MAQSLRKRGGQLFKSLDVESPYNSAIPLQGIYQWEMKTSDHTDTNKYTYTQMFRAALAVTAKQF